MKAIYIVGSLLTAGLILSGCDNNDNTIPLNNLGNAPAASSQGTPSNTAPGLNTATGAAANTKQSYKVTVENLTLSQPMSPLAAAYHTESRKLFEVGVVSGEALEKLAEGGDNSALLASLASDKSVTASSGGTGLILPGKADSVTLEGEAAKCISIAAMLVNTNDAFAGADCVNVSAMKQGEVVTMQLPAYDAGTEANSEEAVTIPGPAGGGEGFNQSRDDRDFISVHSGVVTKDDGLNGSALTQAHKWDNPAAMLTIERVK